MALHPGAADMLVTVTDAPMISTSEDLSKKVRKPYTITKSRESWTEQEHDKFLEALQLFDRDWKKIEAFVGSKTVIQIRSHAQKYFLKVQKNGTGEHVPPPRPKRKSLQPYPQKAPKSAPVTSQGATSMSLTEPAYPVAMQPCAVRSVSSGSAMPTWVHHMAPPGSIGFVNKGIPATGIGSIGFVPQMDQSGFKVESPSILSQKMTTMSQGTGEIVLRAMPDFTEIYSFLGSVFDPTVNGHLERMREMAPIDRETVLLLMRNLSINLSSSDLEEHKLFLSVYDMEPDDAAPGAEDDIRSVPEAAVASQPPLDGGDGTLVSGIRELREVKEKSGRKMTDELNARRGSEVTQSYTDKISQEQHLRGNETAVQLSQQAPLLADQGGGAACEGSEVVKYGNTESEESEPGREVDSLDAAELEDSKGKEAEIVDMWWS